MPDLLISYSECLELLGITSQEGEDFDGFSIRPSGVTLLPLASYGVTLTPHETQALHTLTPGEFCGLLRGRLDDATPEEERAAIRMFLAHPRIGTPVAAYRALLLTHPDRDRKALRKDRSEEKLTPEQERVILSQAVPLEAAFFDFPVSWAVFKRFLNYAGWTGYVDATKAVDWLLAKGLQPQVEPELPAKSRNTFVVLIAALCQRAGIDYQQRGAAKLIAELTDVLGAPVTDDTIRPILKAIPDAIERRAG